MAAPHVAGLLLMGNVKTGDMVKANGGGYADPFALELAKRGNSHQTTNSQACQAAEPERTIKILLMILPSERKKYTLIERQSSDWQI